MPGDGSPGRRVARSDEPARERVPPAEEPGPESAGEPRGRGARRGEPASERGRPELGAERVKQAWERSEVAPGTPGINFGAQPSAEAAPWARRARPPAGRHCRPAQERAVAGGAGAVAGGTGSGLPAGGLTPPIGALPPGVGRGGGATARELAACPRATPQAAGAALRGRLAGRRVAGGAAALGGGTGSGLPPGGTPRRIGSVRGEASARVSARRERQAGSAAGWPRWTEGRQRLAARRGCRRVEGGLTG